MKPILLQKDSTTLFCFDSKQTTFIRKQLELKLAYSEKLETQDFLINNLRSKISVLENQFSMMQEIEKNKNFEIKLKNDNLKIKDYQIDDLKTEIKKLKKLKKIMIAGITLLTSGFIYKLIKQ